MRAIAGLTVRQLLGQKRTLLMLFAGALPVVMAIVVAFAGDPDDRPEFVASRILAGLVAGTLLPIVALIFGTSALGSEIDDGTAVYLLARPIPRWRVLGAKLAVAWLATAVLVAPVAMISGTIALAGEEGSGLPLAFAIASVAGALVYTALFVFLSLLTGRALIVGLVYVFLWEQVVTRLFGGTRTLSVREYTRGIADLLSTADRSTYHASLGGAEAAVLALLVAAVAAVLAVRRLERFEVGESV